MRICLLAPSGYGKSTAIELLKIDYKIVNLKIAEPLYELQKIFYDKIKMDIANCQDGELLQFLGIKIRKENASFLINEFINKLAQIDEREFIITNDDCRPYDYGALKQLDFIFVKINGFSRERDDHTKADKDLSIEWQNDFPSTIYELNNYGSLDEYREEVINLMHLIRRDQSRVKRR